MAPTSMEAHAKAVDQAQAWLRKHNPQIRSREPTGVHVHSRDAGEPRERWRCEVVCPHPLDETMEVTATASGYDRDGSLETAIMELRGFLQRCYLDERGETRRLLRQREQQAYEPSPQAIDKVLRCLRDRQILDVGSHRVGAIGARLHAEARGLPLTVGDVVQQVIAEISPADQMRLGA